MNKAIIMKLAMMIKGITKFWEILKNGWIVILYNFDIF